MTATVSSAATSTGSSAASSNVRGARSSLVAPIACGCCLFAGAAYIGVNDPSQGGGFLPCPFRSLTGWWCPGCGLTRATHHLIRGDIAQALRFNLFVVVVVATIATAWTAWFLAAVGRSDRMVGRMVGRVLSPPAWLPVVAVTTLVVFAVVRNLPGVPALRG